MKKVYLIILMISISSISYTQNCDCPSNLKWLIETFEKNDAGFQYIINQKGKEAYQTHNASFFKMASQTNDLLKCHKLLNDWSEFFRKNHLNIKLLEKPKSSDQKKKLSDVEIIEKYKKTEQFVIGTKELKKHLKKSNDVFEGIWNSEPYKIAIIKDNRNNKRAYVGFLLNSPNPYWQKNQVKLEIFKENNGTYTMKFYYRNHSSKTYKNIDLYGNNYLIAGGGQILLKKEYDTPLAKDDKDKNIEVFNKSMYARKTFVEKISKNTVLIRIPSFKSYFRKYIDSILDSNKELIKNTDNLIIDLRYNTGGADSSTDNLLSFIYTNPIKVIGTAFYSTELNNERMKKYASNKDFSESDRKQFKAYYEKLNKHIGEFVNLQSEMYSMIKMDTVLPNPKKVAILVNEYCASATEQFLLAAKQSTKVKLFGKTSAGALDISNLNSVVFPSKKFELWYGTSKSYRIPEMQVDGKGLQPDFYFDKSIPDYLWIVKAKEILEKK